MKTSVYVYGLRIKQFELMITYMEQHGDIGKPITDSEDTISNLELWGELCNLLNSERSGDIITIEKCKKVWNDYKSNTQKKAARLHEEAISTGDGPAVFAKLSDFEHRVLNIMGVKVPEGLTLDEARLMQETQIQPKSQIVEKPIQLPIEFVPMLPEPPQILPAQTGDTYPSQDSYHEMETQAEPALSGQTISQAARPAHSQRSLRRRVRSAVREQAAHFLQAGNKWRKLKRAQHRDYMKLRWEEIKIRELELQTQREWQKIALSGLDILDKIVTKHCVE